MLYALFPGGKRLRPILALSASEACGGQKEACLPFAAALEIVHAYSLVHDDLPAMDNDAFRRGQPSCHKKFGEAIAILAGDALLTFAFELMSRADDMATSLAVIREVSARIGSLGMVGGQTVDVLSRGGEMDQPTIEYIYTHKTGQLIAASVRVGGMAAGASPESLASLTRYGEYLGFAFQMTDDILDHEGFARTRGPEATREEARAFIAKAKDELTFLQDRAGVLAAIADRVLVREN
ncbi:MAG: polyprenyl synthetase family protein [Candidatus Omnitrophica bacterium]|nr:polyprenyl synthetase family protein [Candidatus Omnitrophota bacterium]